MHFELMRFGSFDFGQLSLTVWLLIGLALIFDFLNGFHDTANSIATVVSTRVLAPHWAVMWAAFFNFAAFLVFPLKVADTIASGVVDPEKIQAGVNGVIFATLLAACAWNVLTWWLALPTSSSHALIGGLIGSALAMTGSLGVLVWEGVLKTLLFIVLSPLIGFTCGLGMAVIVYWLCRAPVPGRRDFMSPVLAVLLGCLVGWGAFGLADTLWPHGHVVLPGAGPEGTGFAVNWAAAVLVGGVVAVLAYRLLRWIRQAPSPQRVDQVFRKGQLLSAAWFSLTHGGNDAQKTMGIIFMLLTAAQAAHASPGTAPPRPFEVVLACQAAIALGTLFGGWRIVKTMGQKIIKLRPVDGFCAENGAGLAVALATGLAGIPVSTTHTVTGAIVGVGSLKRLSAVRWGVAGRVVWAWVLTLPGAALIAALGWWLWLGLNWLGGQFAGG